MMVDEEDDDRGVNPCVMIGPAVVARMHTNVDRGLIMIYVYGKGLIDFNIIGFEAITLFYLRSSFNINDFLNNGFVFL